MADEEDPTFEEENELEEVQKVDKERDFFLKNCGV